MSLNDVDVNIAKPYQLDRAKGGTTDNEENTGTDENT